MKKKTLLIAETAVLIALLVAIQFVTKPLGQFVTGSLVNLILGVAALFSGLVPGIIVALVSPFFAFMLGIGTPLIQIVPFIALGNLAFVLVLHFLYKKNAIVSVVCAAVLKFVTLFVLVTKVVLPSMGLPAPKLAVLSANFSWPQLVTALIGGVLTILIVPVIKKGLKR